MTEEQFIAYCLTLDGAKADKPFEGDFHSLVLRHGNNKKWFALIMELDGKTVVNMKCDPMESDFLRSAFKGVIPAYHMNKVHWNTVFLDSDVPDEEIMRMAKVSYGLTAQKKRMSRKKSAAEENALLAVEGLEKIYPDAKCSLVYEKPYELMIAGRLSAQCTDARVNIVTKELFAKYTSLEAFANADVNDIAEIIKPCGLFKTKAESIVGMTSKLLSDFGGEIPKTIEELTTLPGIGRKTANLIMGDVHHLPAVVTDTHCIRICGRLRLTDNTEPAKVENDLRKILPPEKSSDFCHRIVIFGRDTCTARNPKCESCPLREHMCKNGRSFSCKL